jgi:glycosyltransferase involved in cell wall biosynthesis
MKLSVIVPVYNEENTVHKTLKKLAAIKQVQEIVVVNDGSTDKTEKEVKKLKSSKIKYFKKTNGGKGSAVRYGLKKVTGDHTLIQDADLEYDPADIPALIKHVDREGVEVIYGSRFLGPHSNLLFWHRVGNSMLNLIVNILYNTTLSDMETCYKLLPTKLFKDINVSANGFDIEPEITCKILRRGIRIYEVPISYVGRDFSEGKKITWRDGFDALRVILGLRFLPKSLFN